MRRGVPRAQLRGGVAAVLFGGGAFAAWPVAVAPSSTFPIWPVYLFGGVAAVALYMCFATIWQWWPTSRTVQGPLVDAITPVQGPDTGTSASLPPPPVAIRLSPELDVAAIRFRLGALNRDEFGRFRVEVIDARDQDGNWPGPRSWPVPWLEDGSVTSKGIPMGGRPLLDFAHFDIFGLKEEIEGTKRVPGNHCVFSSLPQPVPFTYSAVKTWTDLRRQYVVMTLRVIREAPEGHVDVQFQLGWSGAEPYCRELPGPPRRACQ